jgi:hypothetical protein
MTDKDVIFGDWLEHGPWTADECCAGAAGLSGGALMRDVTGRNCWHVADLEELWQKENLRLSSGPAY